MLRQALGERARHVVAPHLTFVPPVNVRGERLGEALALVRAAAATHEPLAVALGPVSSFDPVTPTLHLVVPGGAEPLASLRAAMFRPPLHRPVEHPFVPHVTLRDWAPRHVITAARQALAPVRLDSVLDRLSVLAEQRDDAGRRVWRPVADVDLGGVRAVGRGGLPTELASGSVVDPEAAAAFPDAPAAPVGGVVVTARRDGRVVGVGWPGGCRAVEDEVAHLVTAEVLRLAPGGAGEPFSR